MVVWTKDKGEDWGAKGPGDHDILVELTHVGRLSPEILRCQCTCGSKENIGSGLGFHCEDKGRPLNLRPLILVWVCSDGTRHTT